MRFSCKYFFFLLFILLTSCAPQVSLDEGKVVSIADGDTFTLLTDGKKQLRIRLHGIDCPEKGQEFGTAARRKLSQLIFGQRVWMEQKDTDRYGRIIAVVYRQGESSVNEQLLEEGFAWHYKEYDQNPDWARLEKEARRKRKGLWSHANPTAPWLFRKAKREKAGT